MFLACIHTSGSKDLEILLAWFSLVGVYITWHFLNILRTVSSIYVLSYLDLQDAKRQEGEKDRHQERKVGCREQQRHCAPWPHLFRELRKEGASGDFSSLVL